MSGPSGADEESGKGSASDAATADTSWAPFRVLDRLVRTIDTWSASTQTFPLFHHRSVLAFVLPLPTYAFIVYGPSCLSPGGGPALRGWVPAAMVGGAVVNRQTVSREDALIAHTRKNSFLILQESNLGSIQPGKLADLVVLDRDYLTIPADQIKDIKPVMTMVGGRIAYEAGK